MTSGGNSFNDFPEIVPTREITSKVEKTSSVAVGLFLAWALITVITPKQHDIQTIDIAILHKENTNHANIKT